MTTPTPTPTAQHRYVVQFSPADSNVEWESGASFDTEDAARGLIYEAQAFQRKMFGDKTIEMPTRILDTETGEATEVPW